ncbi:hypothetical protein POSPLADRAFT_1033730 [Postia placenta MAD-698-R-SB12]|uniref:Uncharacterized protein n=1 Tax=Postia placenta MAD-698-R-SB12 TaxID=670580 RepID=A0A1X6N0F3_9APHY|nr:hypothetical protein POSPLADRAFT_1033730 [Postia placenta MAD-698-R-SB12]OSX61966.1 hypothetical protein POSPLADRAFT_1033730 [Postia placenta MAD-698-R-SB12]
MSVSSLLEEPSIKTARIGTGDPATARAEMVLRIYPALLNAIVPLYSGPSLPCCPQLARTATGKHLPSLLKAAYSHFEVVSPAPLMVRKGGTLHASGLLHARGRQAAERRILIMVYSSPVPVFGFFCFDKTKELSLPLNIPYPAVAIIYAIHRSVRP